MKSLEELYSEISTGRTSELNADVARLIERCLDADVESTWFRHPTIQAHPLGFLSIRWDINSTDQLRIHLWDKSFTCVQSPNWPIHDHIFSFRSVVLVGTVQNKTYSEVALAGKRQWRMFDVHYNDGVSSLHWNGKSICLVQQESLVQISGSYYDIQFGVLHRSQLRSEFAVTVLATSANRCTIVRPRVVGDNSRASLTFNRDVREQPSAELLMRKGILELRSKTEPSQLCNSIT